MKRGSDQYPEAYQKDHSQYSYYTDTNDLITIKAGEDGVTEKWIALLKRMHRDEINMLRRGRSKGNGENKLLSLSWIESRLQDKSDIFSDSLSGVEDEYINRVDREEAVRVLQEALNGITAEQRYILYAVHVKNRTMTDVAHELGITRQSLTERLQRIEKKLQKNILKNPCVLAFSAHRCEGNKKAA